MTFAKKIKFLFIRKTLKFLIHTIVFFNKIKIEGNENLLRIKEKKEPIIFAFWHKKIFFTIYQFKNSGASPLISNSEDGEFVSQVAEEFKMIPVRGSSSKGGARAFIKMMNSIKENKSHILITADGPKGPPQQTKDGVIKLAEKTGAAIIPISWTASKLKIFEKSWDKFEIPLPFGEIIFRYGKPIYVEKENKISLIDYQLLIKTGIDSLEEAKGIGREAERQGE